MRGDRGMEQDWGWAPTDRIQIAPMPLFAILSPYPSYPPISLGSDSSEQAAKKDQPPVPQKSTEGIRRMLIVWGSRRKIKTINAEGERVLCPNCNVESRFVEKQVVTYFTLYFIPLFPTHRGER